MAFVTKSRRNTSLLLSDNSTESVGPGSYDPGLPVKPKSALLAPFMSTSARPTIGANATEVVGLIGYDGVSNDPALHVGHRHQAGSSHGVPVVPTKGMASLPQGHSAPFGSTLERLGLFRARESTPGPGEYAPGVIREVPRSACKTFGSVPSSSISDHDGYSRPTIPSTNAWVDTATPPPTRADVTRPPTTGSFPTASRWEECRSRSPTIDNSSPLISVAEKGPRPPSRAETLARMRSSPHRQAWSLSEVTRSHPTDSTPGPGAYCVNSPSPMRRREEFQFFGSTVPRLGPDNGGSVPGPGHYNIRRELECARTMRMRANSEPVPTEKVVPSPGPGDYEPHHLPSESVNLAAVNGILAFGSVAPRFTIERSVQLSPEREMITGNAPIVRHKGKLVHAPLPPSPDFGHNARVRDIPIHHPVHVSRPVRVAPKGEAFMSSADRQVCEPAQQVPVDRSSDPTGSSDDPPPHRERRCMRGVRRRPTRRVIVHVEEEGTCGPGSYDVTSGLIKKSFNTFFN